MHHRDLPEGSGHDNKYHKAFRIAVGDEVLDDLKSRLRKTRWPEAELVDDWSQGAPLKCLKEVCRYWAGDLGGEAVVRNIIVWPRGASAMSLRWQTDNR